MIELDNIIIKKISDTLRSHGVCRAAVFGSFARNEATEKSDLDVLVDMPEGKSLFDLIEIKLELEEKFDIKIDLVTYESLNEKIKGQILSEKVEIL